MELHYEASLSAYLILHEVIKELKAKGDLIDIERERDLRKIIQLCNKIIDNRYNEGKKKILKNYISNILLDEFGSTAIV